MPSLASKRRSRGRHNCPAPIRGKNVKKLATNGTFNRFFRFDTMVSGYLISLLYYPGAVLVTVVGLVFFGTAVRFGDIPQALIALGSLSLGNVLWRVVCEAAILAFRAYETLRSIDDSMATIEEDLSVLSGRGELTVDRDGSAGFEVSGKPAASRSTDETRTVVMS